MAIARLGSITLDCDDPEPLAAFWAELLGGKIILSNGKFVMVQVSHTYLTAHRVPGYRAPVWPEEAPPKQIHLDLAAHDLDAAQEQAAALGARIADHQPNPDVCRVLFDPAGHPFCFSRPMAQLLDAASGS
ncbi:VOC family protein [Nocardia huaxiensis]|uniref:VOC family protein n=1 Tax=Nocardia huaxiensis TaxID=2755382 RepID=A0A7D6ZFG5_9NOCA|nr:VOC family protein [Nocardia huaxiensis]QLY29659.1 VOC family protein [Nocardia huaxiensis]UFS96767.1 VOC family protein [Nocardia huaxiensis]